MENEIISVERVAYNYRSIELYREFSCKLYRTFKAGLRVFQ